MRDGNETSSYTTCTPPKGSFKGVLSCFNKATAQHCPDSSNVYPTGLCNTTNAYTDNSTVPSGSPNVHSGSTLSTSAPLDIGPITVPVTMVFVVSALVGLASGIPHMWA